MDWTLVVNAVVVAVTAAAAAGAAWWGARKAGQIAADDRHELVVFQSVIYGIGSHVGSSRLAHRFRPCVSRIVTPCSRSRSCTVPASMPSMEPIAASGLPCP